MALDDHTRSANYDAFMPITFEQPLWLLVALVALPMAWVGWAWLASMTGARRWSAIVLRTVLIGLIACMLAGASSVRLSDRVAVVAVVDASDSVRRFADAFADLPETIAGERPRWHEAVRRWIVEASASKHPDDLLGVIVFDREASALFTPTTAPDPEPALDRRLGEGTDIASALRLARALFPAGTRRRVVLFSDGNQTAGDAIAAAGELGGDAIPVDVVPLTYRVHNEVMVESVDAPPQAGAGATVPVRVVLRSTDGARGTLELLYEGRAVDLNGPAPGTGRRVDLPAGLSAETLEVALGDTTLHRFEAVFVPDSSSPDALSSNNHAEAFTVTPGRGRVLLVDGVSGATAGGGGLSLAGALTGAGIETLAVAPEQVPQELAALNAFDLVILENVASDTLAHAVQTALGEYVTRLGGGLVMVGGPDSFGAGGWKGTPLEPILPVRLDLPEQVIAPPSAVALVLDNSGSMRYTLSGGSVSKQRIVNEGAALAVLTLDRTDVLCVIAFNSSPDIVIPVGRNTDPNRSADIVRSIGSGGGTRIGPALALAERQLAPVNSPVKHVILLTDGRDEQNSNIVPIARRLREQKITVSTIGVGDDVDDAMLSAVAKEGGGKFYYVTDPSILPRVFVKEVRVVRKPLIRETPFVPLVGPMASPLAEGLGDLPPLGGLVLTRPRTEPTAITAMSTPEHDPVLAHWVAGRGQVAAFTSDAHAWAGKWLNWPGYSAFWSRLVRSISRPSATAGGELSVEASGDSIVVRFDSADALGRPINLLAVPGTLFDPDGIATDLRLSQTGPGVYETRLPARRSGSYVVALTPSSHAGTLAPVIGGVSVASGVELRRLSSDTAILDRIASTSRGRVLDLRAPQTANLYDRSGLKPTSAALPLWRTLLAWTLVVLVLDIGTRRLAWDRLISREWRSAMRELSSQSVRAAGERAAATVASLRRAVEHGAEPSIPDAQPPVDGIERTVQRNERADQDEAQRLRQAQALAEAEARRHADRARALRELSGHGAAKASSDGPSSTENSGGADDATRDSLLQAKRRARERFDPDA